MAAYTAGRTGGSYAEGIEVMIRAALQSSHFLYRLETTAPASAAAAMVPLSQYELATRLSYLIWAAGPDDALLDAAGRGELSRPRRPSRRKARTMLADPKARVAVTDFYKQWLGTSRLDITTKSTTAFPAFTDAAREGMQPETPAFVEYVLWTGDHKLATLLTSPVDVRDVGARADLRRDGAGQQRHGPARWSTLPAEPGARRRADAGGVPVGAGAPRSDVAGAARQVRALEHDVPAAADAADGHRHLGPRRSVRARPRASVSPRT